jgi:hypothetical protein
MTALTDQPRSPAAPRRRRPKDIGTATETARTCKLCGAPRPKGRVRYCGDECSSLALAAAERARRAKRMAACKRCLGPKESGTRGGKYCDECRRVIADSSAQAEYERARRRNLAEVQRKVTAGEPIRRRTIDVPHGMKWCPRCQDFRPLTSFPGRKQGGKPGAYCVPCQRSYNRERRVLLHYGLTYDEYELLLACQDYRCAICGGKPRKHSLSVDHDHKTGEVRGLLCSRCNHKLLGSANDDPARLRKAADYLEQYAPREVFGERKFVPGSESA